MIDSSSESGDENKARRKERPLRKEDKSLGDVLLKSESSDLFVTAVDLNVTGCVQRSSNLVDLQTIDPAFKDNFTCTNPLAGSELNILT